MQSDDNLPRIAITDPATFAREAERFHDVDVVEALDAADADAAARVLENMPVERAAAILEHPGLDRVAELIARLPADHAAGLLRPMSADRRADLFRRLPEPLRSSLLARLDPAVRASLQQLLSYPPESAGRIMTTEYVGVPADWTVEQALRHIRAVGGRMETIYAIYILDPGTSRLARAISLRELILAEAAAPVMSVGPAHRLIAVSPTTDREEVTRLISKYDLIAVPVIDETGRMLGIVTVDDVLDAIVEEDTEDAQKFGGMEALDEPYMRIGFATMIRKRAGWLSALFLSEMLTASAMQSFQSELERAVVLALFIPLIMSSGGNSGSQATSLVIRALALRELKLGDWWRIALRELPTGATLGAILGLIGVVRIAVWQLAGIYDYGPHWRLVALTVGTALVGIVTFGSLSGSMLPFALKRIGFDPASASAPFVATLVDVTGLVIYFSVAYAILKGTLL
ncbi:MAG: magnesium transporter [Xanthobacteraceae bacterium]